MKVKVGPSYFITARITLTCILYQQCTHMIFIMYISSNKHCSKSSLSARLLPAALGLVNLDYSRLRLQLQLKPRNNSEAPTGFEPIYRGGHGHILL